MIAHDYAAIHAAMRDGTTLGDALEASAAARRAPLPLVPPCPDLLAEAAKQPTRVDVRPIVKTNVVDIGKRPWEGMAVSRIAFYDAAGVLLFAEYSDTLTVEKWFMPRALAYDRAVFELLRLPGTVDALPDGKPLLSSALDYGRPGTLHIGHCCGPVTMTIEN